MTMAKSGAGVHCASSRAGRPSGAVTIVATPSVRHTTGSAPLRSCSGRARLMAAP